MSNAAGCEPAYQISTEFGTKRRSQISSHFDGLLVIEGNVVKCSLVKLRQLLFMRWMVTILLYICCIVCEVLPPSNVRNRYLCNYVAAEDLFHMAFSFYYFYLIWKYKHWRFLPSFHLCSTHTYLSADKFTSPPRHKGHSRRWPDGAPRPIIRAERGMENG